MFLSSSLLIGLNHPNSKEHIQVTNQPKTWFRSSEPLFSLGIMHGLSNIKDLSDPKSMSLLLAGTIDE